MDNYILKQTSFVRQDLNAHHHFLVHYRMTVGLQLIYLMVFLGTKIIIQKIHSNSSCHVVKQ